ncbi:MAG: GNAT family N-acetyltransferase [Pseudomonadota bacterium]
MSYACRVLEAADAADFRAVRLDALERYPTAFLTTAEEFRVRPLSAHEEALAQGKSWGVFDGPALAGIGALLPLPYAAAAHRAEIGAFYVCLAHQGRGAADALLQAMATSARARGIWQLELFVAEDNPRARAFYARHGFAELGRLPNAALIADVMTSDIFMVADLR